MPDVLRIANRGWDALGLHQAGALIEKGQAQANLVAAMPSLHGAFTAMLLVFVWGALGRVGRTLMVAYTLAMGLALVYGGEHYVVDILDGLRVRRGGRGRRGVVRAAPWLGRCHDPACPGVGSGTGRDRNGAMSVGPSSLAFRIINTTAMAR